MMLLEYETRLQQPRTAVVPDDFDLEAWKRRMIEDDLMTKKNVQKMTVRRFDWRQP